MSDDPKKTITQPSMSAADPMQRPLLTDSDQLDDDLATMPE